MVEQNEVPQKQAPKQEVCTIRIMFPVTSDEHALDIKTKVAALLSDIEQVRSEFSISSMNR